MVQHCMIKIALICFAWQTTLDCFANNCEDPAVGTSLTVHSWGSKSICPNPAKNTHRHDGEATGADYADSVLHHHCMLHYEFLCMSYESYMNSVQYHLSCKFRVRCRPRRRWARRFKESIEVLESPVESPAGAIQVILPIGRTQRWRRSVCQKQNQLSQQQDLQDLQDLQGQNLKELHQLGLHQPPQLEP